MKFWYLYVLHQTLSNTKKRILHSARVQSYVQIRGKKKEKKRKEKKPEPYKRIKCDGEAYIYFFFSMDIQRAKLHKTREYIARKEGDVVQENEKKGE